MGFRSISALHDANAALTDFALWYMQQDSNFIAEKIAPPLKVAKENDKYYKFDRGNWRTTYDIRQITSEANRTNMPVLSTDSYSVEQHSLFDLVDYREISNADNALTPRQDAVASIMEQLMVNREVAVAQTFFTTTAVGSKLSGSTATQWDYTSTTTPIEDITARMFAVNAEIARMPNTAYTGPDVWRVLKNHADVLDRIKYTQKGVVGTDLLASLLGVNQFLVGNGVQMTTVEGEASEAVAYIYADNVLVSYVNPNPSKKALTHGHIFTTESGGVTVREWDQQANSSVHIEGSIFYDDKIVCSLCAGGFFDALA